MPKILFLGTKEDASYLSYLKGCFPGNVSCSPVTQEFDTLFQLETLAKAKGFTGIVSTQKNLLAKLLDWKDNRKEPSLDAYQGSIFKRNGLEYTFINPLEQLVSVPYAQFIAKRFISKLANPDSWRQSSSFHWTLLDGGTVDIALCDLLSCYAASFDIETFSTPLSIRCLGFTTINFSAGNVTTNSYVLPINSDWAMAWCRRFCDTQVQKIFANGKYDNAYLSMFKSCVRNWLWDVQTAMHSWYAELPKDLAFLNSFFVRDSMYWKDLANTNDLEEYYRYNALDTWATANVWIAQMMEMPEFARQNYLMEFPINFPAHMCEMRGIRRDPEKMVSARAECEEELSRKQVALEKMIGVPGFNTNSYIQVRKLLKALTGKEHTDSDEKYLEKIKLLHPLNSRILGNVLDIRGLRKLKTTYLRTDADITKTSPGGAKEYRGRILYAINPHGTDSGRCASKESHFWCGLQIQNIPRGKEVKQTLVADPGFRIAEVDLEQAESRHTGYIAGELRLINAVESPRDFHSVNASAFFGVSYDSIYDDIAKKTKDKKLRDLAKRVNHGANYCMGANVLILTMGEDKVREAGRLLGLPRNMSLKDIAEHLLDAFHATYPGLRQLFYPAVVAEAENSKMLVGPQGWTRYTWLKPGKNKLHFNSLVAHVPQNSNAMNLNKSFLRVFYEIAMHPQYRMHFKLLAQIHDSILFQIREGHEYLADMVRRIMEIETTVKGADGVTRTFLVPAAIKAGPDGKGALSWADTE